MLLLLGSFSSDAASANTDTAETTAVTLDHTRQWEMHNAQGRAYRIMISLPDGDPPQGGYPVLYVLDGNAYFPAFHAARDTVARYHDTVIVGIGYPQAQALNFRRRSYDFSPPAPADRNEPPQGGQDELLAFLEQRLMPRVASDLPIDSRQQSLFGHSFGGMFAIYTMFKRPALFNHVVAASPSLWWRDQYLLPLEPEFQKAMQKRPKHPPSLVMILAEGDMPQQIRDARSLNERLQPLSAYGMRSSFTLVAGVDHATVPFKTVALVMREVFESP
ncbi:alpha/beta hydrolase [Kushneria avicenniae]|nr:alpha/beta hydrolase-fold protein [Kushneria avicenniae]